MTRSALDAIGASSAQAWPVLRTFESRRLDCEIAALVKYRRATSKMQTLEITAADLAAIERSHAA